MAYIGNNIDISKVRFAEMKATSLDKSAIQTIYLGGGEDGDIGRTQSREKAAATL